MNLENPDLARIRRLSRRIQRLLLLAMLIPPLALAWYWTFYNTLPADAQAGPRLDILIVGPVPALSRAAAFGVSMAAACVFLWGLWTLVRLFRLYESGRIFEMENVACFRTLGRVFIGQAAANLMLPPLLSVILTLHNPAGQKQLALSFGSGVFFLFLAGAIVLVIASVMEEGRKLEEERRLTI